MLQIGVHTYTQRALLRQSSVLPTAAIRKGAAIVQYSIRRPVGFSHAKKKEKSNSKRPTCRPDRRMMKPSAIRQRKCHHQTSTDRRADRNASSKAESPCSPVHARRRTRNAVKSAIDGSQHQRTHAEPEAAGSTGHRARSALVFGPRQIPGLSMRLYHGRLDAGQPPWQGVERRRSCLRRRGEKTTPKRTQTAYWCATVLGTPATCGYRAGRTDRAGAAAGLPRPQTVYVAVHVYKYLVAPAAAGQSQRPDGPSFAPGSSKI